MKSIVIYNSQTGFTKKYAEWISEAVNCECVNFKKGSKMKLDDYDAIIFGSWCMAGSITKIDWLKKQMPALAAAGKKIIVFAVGASPAEAPEVQIAMDQIFTESEKSMAKLFYCSGGICYDKMKPASKFAMKAFAKILSSKKDATKKELEQAKMVSSSYDISDKKYINPILDALK